MNNLIIEICSFLVILVLLSIPLGNYIYRVMNGHSVFLYKVFSPWEDRVYTMMGIMDADSALEKFEAGASLVQLYTGFIYKGPALVREICQRILQR